MSHPAWVCGLKLRALLNLTSPFGHTLRGCVDWNRTATSWHTLKTVTPCVGVWIETWISSGTGSSPGHTLRGCVDWNMPAPVLCQAPRRHTLRGCVDWNIQHILHRGFETVTPCVGVWIETFLGSSASSTSCHTLRGCVDWNGKQLNQHLILHCHTLRGCVDWNFTLCNLYYWPRVTPCVGVWIETIMHPRQTGQGIVTPCVGVWIETYSEHIANVQKGHTLRGCVDWNWEACAGYIMDVVTPCVGVWIETMTRWIRV